jgi:hypothetical protein
MKDIVFGSYKRLQGWIIFCCVLCLLVGFVFGLLFPIPKVALVPKTAPTILVEQTDVPFTVDSIGFFDSFNADGWNLSHYRDTERWRIMVFVNDNVTIQYSEKSWNALIKDLKETKWPER